MSRPRAAVLALIGLASPVTGAAQTTTAGWTVAAGEYTVFGHTLYTNGWVLQPRIVFDSVAKVDSARVVDSVRLAAAKPVGLAAGLSAWPADLYCDGITSGAMQSLEPKAILGRLQLASRCGVRLVIVPPQRLITATGANRGPFSVDSAKRLMDRYAAVLPPDTLRKYRGTILGMNLADDYGCADCWGGTPLTQAQIAAWAAYTRARLPGVPLGVRVTPDWVAAYPVLAPHLDYAWAQYHTKKGDPRAYYDNAARVAERLGLRVIMGVNVEDCYGVGTSACAAEDLVRLGTMAVTHPASCAFINWRYSESTWVREDIRKAWDGLLAAARGREARECRRAV